MRSSNRRQFEDSVRLVAEGALPSRGRTMRVFSNQPGLQLYTGNFLPRAGMRGKVRPRTAHTSHLTRALRAQAGANYTHHGALCLETQNFPDFVNNRGSFPSGELRPGHTYVHQLGVQLLV